MHCSRKSQAKVKHQLLPHNPLIPKTSGLLQIPCGTTNIQTTPLHLLTQITPINQSRQLLIFGSKQITSIRNQAICGINQTIYGNKLTIFGSIQTTSIRNQATTGINQTIFGNKQTIFGSIQTNLVLIHLLFGNSLMPSLIQLRSQQMTLKSFKEASRVLYLKP